MAYKEIGKPIGRVRSGNKRRPDDANTPSPSASPRCSMVRVMMPPYRLRRIRGSDGTRARRRRRRESERRRRKRAGSCPPVGLHQMENAACEATHIESSGAIGVFDERFLGRPPDGLGMQSGHAPLPELTHRCCSNHWRRQLRVLPRRSRWARSSGSRKGHSSFRLP